MRQKTAAGSLVVGLGRHRLTEQLESSLATVFTGFEQAVRGYTVRLLPSFADFLPERDKRAIWIDFMGSCDVVIINEPFPLELRRELGLRTRIVYVPLGELPRGALTLRRALPFFEPGDVVAFSSRADLRIFGNIVTSCAADVVLLPLFIDHRRFRPSTDEERAEVRKHLGVKEDDILFLYVGRITAEKNVHGILKVFERLTATHRNVRLIVVGRAYGRPFCEFGLGPFNMKEIILRMVRKAPLRDSVSFLGWLHQDALPQVYGAADVLINLSLHHDENFGYSQVEAMSCGIPVISTDWGGLKDTVDHGRTGFRVSTWLTDHGVRIDLPAAVQHCRELAGSASLRGAMGRAGRQRVIDLYSARPFREGLARMLAPPAAPGPQRPRDNRLSRFGGVFHQHFSVARGADGGSRGQRQPVLPRYSGRTYGLYKRLIEPYSSCVERPRFRAQDVVFLVRANSSSDKRWFISRELLWPDRFPLNKASRDVVHALERAGEGVVSVGEIRKRLKISAAKSRVVLGELLRAGILGTKSEAATKTTIRLEGREP